MLFFSREKIVANVNHSVQKKLFFILFSCQKCTNLNCLTKINIFIFKIFGGKFEFFLGLEEFIHEFRRIL